MKKFILLLATATLFMGLCHANESQEDQPAEQEKTSSESSSDWDKLSPETQEKISAMENRWQPWDLAY